MDLPTSHLNPWSSVAGTSKGLRSKIPVPCGMTGLVSSLDEFEIREKERKSKASQSVHHFSVHYLPNECQFHSPQFPDVQYRSAFNRWRAVAGVMWKLQVSRLRCPWCFSIRFTAPGVLKAFSTGFGSTGLPSKAARRLLILCSLSYHTHWRKRASPLFQEVSVSCHFFTADVSLLCASPATSHVLPSTCLYITEFACDCFGIYSDPTLWNSHLQFIVLSLGTMRVMTGSYWLHFWAT